jgi:hypothetical protein
LEALVMIARTRRFALSALVTAVLALAAAPLGAQGPAAAATGVEERRQSVTGPTIDRAAVGVRPLSQRPATLEDAEAALQTRLGLGQARALMIVGFAAVVIGLLMDNDPGTLIAVGGAVVGLYGLYHYLR